MSHVQASVTPSQYAAIEAMAASQGVTVSTWARRTLLGALEAVEGHDGGVHATMADFFNQPDADDQMPENIRGDAAVAYATDWAHTWLMEEHGGRCRAGRLETAAREHGIKASHLTRVFREGTSVRRELSYDRTDSYAEVCREADVAGLAGWLMEALREGPVKADDLWRQAAEQKRPFHLMREVLRSEPAIEVAQSGEFGPTAYRLAKRP